MRTLLLGLVLVASLAPCLCRASDAARGFVTVEGRHFNLDGHRWFARGANLWYGAYLGRPSNPRGRERLLRELDRLQRLGVNNLRVLGASEACALAGTVKPAIQSAPGVLNEDVLEGLDFLVAEAGKRGMTLVIFLTNNWDWSGGIPQYLAWTTGKPAQGVDTTPWKEWNRLQSTFFTNKAALGLYRSYVAALVGRTNRVSGIRYRDDPAIMAWELANEPRPGEREEDNEQVFATFLAWVDSTSAYIHSLDPRHLVTTGSEGNMGCLYDDKKVRLVHGVKGIDYMVFHVWPKNWRWFDVGRYRETLGETLRQARDYTQRHLAIADSLNKPCIVEEFGLDRDGGTSEGTATTCRDRYYSEMFSMIEESVSVGGSAGGSNFWIWGGEGRTVGSALAEDGVGAGDMPQEAPGLNTVFDSDKSTLALLSGHFERLRRLETPGVEAPR